MSSSSTNDQTAHDLSRAVSALTDTLQSFKIDIESGKQNCVLVPVDHAPEDDNGAVFLTLIPATEDVKTQVDALQEQLETIEHTLRSRSQWHPQPTSSQTASSAILDISDLKSAIDLLDQVVTHSHPSHQLTPRSSFSTYTWTWDPAWKEFHTHIPEQQTYVYLSRWHLNQARGVWEHRSMAHIANLGPDRAAELLGCWEDWEWDPIWEEWYLDVTQDQEDGEKCCVYASRWRVQDDGEWVYAGRFGGAGAG